ncbi:MAG: hypothetical protein GX621_16160 [Pirellulaceae bacterium]|nr:hypothetical protein [Pirellulaceae bacterium]
MMLVLVFIALVNLFFVLSYKHFSSALRVQTSHRLDRERDEGPVAALAAGLAFLELTTPTPEVYDTFSFSVDPNAENDSDGEHYKVTFKRLDDPPEEPQRWSVEVERIEWEDIDSNWLNLRDEIERLPSVIADAIVEFGQIDHEPPFDSENDYPRAINIPSDEPEYRVIFTPVEVNPAPGPSYSWYVRVEPAS